MHTVRESKVEASCRDAEARRHAARSAAAAATALHFGADRREEVREFELVRRHLRGGAELRARSIDAKANATEITRLPKVEAADRQLAGAAFVVDDER